MLTERGLGAAIRQISERSPIEVITSVETGGPLPQLVETSVYYLVAEALTNATEYGAHRLWISAHVERDHSWSATLAATIVDDGSPRRRPLQGHRTRRDDRAPSRARG